PEEITDMKRMRVTDLAPNPSRLMPTELGDASISHGGIYVFKAGETAHPEAVHVHDTAEVFIFIEGRGVLPIDGVDYPVQTGDVVIVEAGEDHHTRSSVEEPLVAAWYVMGKASNQE
ncbi:MAG: cupin domain-containing protein, partial [Anaerolineae bacterium]|nr:cupin domain-containing protein [Anaerolineae bacterium]